MKSEELKAMWISEVEHEIEVYKLKIEHCVEQIQKRERLIERIKKNGLPQKRYEDESNV